MKQRLLCLFFLLLMVLAVGGCAFSFQAPALSTAASTSVPSPETTAPFSDTSVAPETSQTTEPIDALAQFLSDMSLREKVGQLFIIRPDSLDLSLALAEVHDADAVGVTEVTDQMLQTLQLYPVGGIVHFGKNILSPEQIASFNAALQTASPIPLFLCVDEEGGSVARLANHDGFDLPQYESAAAIQSQTQALAMGNVIGEYLARYGFNVDFAPVADVNTNPDNPVIGDRAFSSDPDTVAVFAGAMANGLRQMGICPVFKHFPGHGNTAEDSHNGIAITYRIADEMKRCEWIPFQSATADDCVMVGHIATPNITGDLTPASLSYSLVTEFLKNQLAFEGLIVTDSLSMGAITDDYTSGEAALAALQAGCDLLLMPFDFTEAFDTVVAAVEDGIYPESQLDAVVLRILAFKQAHGIAYF